jgi:hypothetical protein
MVTHSWVLPWIALAASLAACIACTARLLLSRKNSSDSSAACEPVFAPGAAPWILLAAVAALTAFALLKIGDLLDVDYIPARGLALGIATGIAILAARRGSRANAISPFEISILCLSVVVSRLWLSHGEVSGFGSLIVGMVEAIVCLAGASSLTAFAPAVIFACVAALTAAVGFSRATTVRESYWADIPLVGASVYALLHAIVPATARFAVRAVSIAVSLAVCAALFWLMSQTLAPVWALLIGIAAVAAASAFERVKPVSDGVPIPGAYIAVALAIAAVTAGFLLAAGYGIGLIALGGAMLAASIAPHAKEPAVPALSTSVLAFAVTLLAFRLAVLGTGEVVRSNGPGDIWDLFAIGLGIVGTLILASLLPGSSETGVAIWRRIEYLFAAVVPVVALAYLWQPRAFAGLFVGAALAPVLFAAGGDKRSSDVPLASVFVGIVLLEILPALDEIAKPTRWVRIALVVLLVLVATGRALAPAGRSARGNAAAEGGAG